MWPQKTLFDFESNYKRFYNPTICKLPLMQFENNILKEIGCKKKYIHIYMFIEV